MGLLQNCSVKQDSHQIKNFTLYCVPDQRKRSRRCKLAPKTAEGSSLPGVASVKRSFSGQVMRRQIKPTAVEETRCVQVDNPPTRNVLSRGRTHGRLFFETHGRVASRLLKRPTIFSLAANNRPKISSPIGKSGGIMRTKPVIHSVIIE